jgi:hypothetical protein
MHSSGVYKEQHQYSITIPLGVAHKNSRPKIDFPCRAQFFTCYHGNAYEQQKPSMQQKLCMFQNQPQNVNYIQPSLFNKVLQQTTKTVATKHSECSHNVTMFLSIQAALSQP